MVDQQNTANYPEEIVEFDILQYLLVLRRNWLPAWLTFLVCLGLSAFAAVYTNRPVYESRGQLLFESNNPNSELTGVGLELGELESIGRSNPLETQANLLISRTLISEVVQKLDLRNDLGTFIDPDILKAGLSVKQVPNTDILSVSYKSSDQEFPALFVNELMSAYLAFNAESQQSEALAARDFIERSLPRLEEEAEIASTALQNFKVENQIISLETETNKIANLIGEFNIREGDVGIQLTAAATRAADLRRQLSIGPESALLLSTINDSSGIQEVLTQVQSVETELAEQQALYLPNHPTVENLQRRSDALESLLQQRLSIVLGSQAQVPQRNLQLGSLQQELVSDLVRAESDSLVLQAQIEALRSLRSVYQARANAFPALEKKQLELEQKLNSAQTRYNNFLERLQELNLAENQLQGNNQVRIIDEAFTPDASLTSFNEKLLLAGAGAGIFLAVAVAFALDLLDPKVKTVKALEKMLGYPLLGLIPKFESVAPEVIDNNALKQFGSSEVMTCSPRVIAFSRQPGFAYEAYQRLHASLRVGQKTPRILLVTSSSPSEGKSELTANLAATMAQAGRRVLLIDADLRASTQHNYWNLENKVGTTHVLSGSAAIEDARHSVTSNLDVLTSGITVADPLMLLESPQVSALVQSASQEYDYVLFDAPPIVPVPDALVLGKSCEGVIFVSRPKHVDATSILAAKRLLSKSKLPILGIVATQVEPSDVDRSLAPFAGGYGRYGYGGYGYGQSTSEDHLVKHENKNVKIPQSKDDKQVRSSYSDRRD